MSAARHHDRAVRDGHRPVVGRPPDAGPLRRRTSTTSCRVSSPVATQLLHAVGHRAGRQDPQDRPGRDDVHGRGCSNQGDVHEGLNFAAIHKLPFIFVVENNGYAISVPAGAAGAGPDVADRAAGLRHPGRRRRRPDVLACYAAARDAVARARAGDGPTLIEAKVTRLTGHSSDDQQTKYRSEEELASRAGARPAARVPRAAPRRRRPDRRDRGADRRRDHGRRRRRHRLRRGAARPDPSTA